MGYIESMAKAHATMTEKTVRDSKSGRTIVVRGVGALKGQLTLKKGVDLTKPIAFQTGRTRLGQTRKSTNPTDLQPGMRSLKRRLRSRRVPQ